MNYYTSTRRRKHFAYGVGGVIALAILFFGVLIGGSFLWYYGSEQTMTCTVTEKDRTTNSEGASDMRIYTDECGVLRVEDILVRGIFNSADIYNEIDAGETYDVTTVGYRIPVLSQFPSIIEVTPAQ